MKRLIEEFEFWFNRSNYKKELSEEEVLKIAVKDFYRFFYDQSNIEMEKALLDELLKMRL